MKWQMVPVEPVREMWEAGTTHIQQDPNDNGDERDKHHEAIGRAMCVYTDMLSAAPSPWVTLDPAAPGHELPEKGGVYLCSVATDNGPEVHTLEWRCGRWEFNGEPTYCQSYYFEPTHWMHCPPGPEEQC